MHPRDLVTPRFKILDISGCKSLNTVYSIQYVICRVVYISRLEIVKLLKEYNQVKDDINIPIIMIVKDNISHVFFIIGRIRRKHFFTF